MKKNIIHTLDHGERVTSTYAEIYYDDEYCDFQKPVDEPEDNLETRHDESNEWVSPSDLLIGIIDLKPPFTSKITRGKTHEGILNIGNGVLEKERAVFLRYLSGLLKDNDLAWLYVQEHEKEQVIKKVKEIYHKIFLNKSKIMQKETTEFYEASLLELEEHIRTEVKDVLLSVNANMISEMNFEIKRKLLHEKNILEDVLNKRFNSEVEKLKLYYDLLLKNELHTNRKMINQAIHERNDALMAFCRQIEADNATSTIYVMCTERKKCKIRQFILENYQSAEIAEKVQKIKERQAVIDEYKERAVHIFDINKKWEEKVTKVLQLFLKFISFSLKLLPEQTTFLLDLEKLVVLQLNEIQKQPIKPPTILVMEEDVNNVFKFEDCPPPESVCDKEPFLIKGDSRPSIPTPYGSRETLPSHVDLPFFRVQRQFIYAKCQKIEQVRALLESQRCKCHDPQFQPSPDTSVPSSRTISKQPSLQERESEHESESSNEPLLVEDIHRLHACPVRGCKDWTKRLPFPDLDTYADFTEERFARVKAILGKLPPLEPAPELINAKNIASRKLQFEATPDLRCNVETQYSSQEDLYQLPFMECPCMEDSSGKVSSYDILDKKSSINMNQIVEKRKDSLRKLMQNNPKLVEIFTDETYDFIS